MNRRHLAIVFWLSVLAIAAYLLLSKRSSSPGQGEAPEEEVSAGVAQPPGASTRPVAAPAPTGEQSGGVAAPVPATPQPVPAALKPDDKAPVPGSTETGGGAGAGSAPGTGGTPAADSRATLSKEDIRAAIQELLPEIKDCYQQGLKGNPDLDGTVKVEFVLVNTPDGGSYAREGEINDSTLASPLVEACILSKIQKAKFKDIQGNGEVRVKYPFRMSSGAGGFGGQ